MLEVYATFAEEYMALPVIRGLKTDSEKFAGAEDTYCIEALMQDGKALQSGTSHFLGQNFAKAFDVKFLTKENQQEYVWATSWGASTRLIGALVMAHSDDDGLILPPRIAPLQVVIVPISSKDAAAQKKINEKAQQLVKELKASNISVKFDDNDNNRPGWKFAEYEMKGVPVRIALGARDLENNVAEVVRRDTKGKEKCFPGWAFKLYHQPARGYSAGNVQ
jgi:prolyl-tRNA synthetase